MSSKSVLLWIAAAAVVASGCINDRATLLRDWPPQVSTPGPGAHYGQGVPRASSAAARWFRVEAERGVPEAQFNLGVMYSRGEGVERDSGQALRWLRSAEALGVHQAEEQLGSLYARGEAPDADPEEAARWLQAAADAGNAQAQQLLGNVYASLAPAEPTPPKPAEPALAPLPPPAPDQSPQEQLALGDRYHDGQGVRRDPVYAARLYRRAADAGLPEAQLRLGHGYREGLGVPRDYVLAYQWLSLAAAAGNPTARQELDAVEAKLSSERVLEAQALAREWYDSQAARAP